jgi:hypothetical protein
VIALPTIDGGTAGARRIHDQLIARGDLIEESTELTRGEIGTGQIEAILFTVVRAVTDEDDEHLIVAFGPLRQRTQLTPHRFAIRLVGTQDRDTCWIARELFAGVPYRGRLSAKALLVCLVAAQTCNDQCVGVCVRERCEQTPSSSKRCHNCDCGSDFSPIPIVSS